MKKATIFCNSGYNGQYLKSGESLGASLLTLIEELREIESFKNDSKLKVLFDINTKGIGTADSLFDTFHDNVSIDYEFAKSLQLYDNIGSDQLYSDTEVGKGLVELIDSFRFILYKRSWEASNNLRLEFEVVQSEFEDEVHCKIIRGEYMFEN